MFRCFSSMHFAPIGSFCGSDNGPVRITPRLTGLLMCLCFCFFPPARVGMFSVLWCRVLIPPGLCSREWWESNSKYRSVFVAFVCSSLLRLLSTSMCIQSRKARIISYSHRCSDVSSQIYFFATKLQNFFFFNLENLSRPLCIFPL